MARASISVLAVLVLLSLVFAPAHSQDVTNTTSTDPVATDVDSNTTATTCPLSADALEGVDFSSATTACSDIDDTDFCSGCLCSVATALVSGSPTFAALANGTTNTTNLNLNTLVEQCAGTLGPVLLSALSTDSLTALAACDLNAAALTCSGGNTTAAETEEIEDVMASQGPATPTPVPMPAAPRASSGAEGVLVSVLLAAPVMIAALWM